MRQRRVAFLVSIYDLCTKPGHFIGPRHLFFSLAFDEKLTSSNASTWLVYTGTSKAFLKSLPSSLPLPAASSRPCRRRNRRAHEISRQTKRPPAHPGCSAGRRCRDAPPGRSDGCLHWAAPSGGTPARPQQSVRQAEGSGMVAPADGSELLSPGNALH